MTTYSSLGMVKLSRTNFGFLTLAGFSAFTGLVGLAGAALTGALVVVVLRTGLAATFLTTDFLAAGFWPGVFVVARDLTAA
ncbi:hypothetical protein LMORI2_10470 [Limnohabitans sp. MORI2]|nr:hypothetical protein LMORI2_10470 [Limnohabitans sp. MORI2]